MKINTVDMTTAAATCMYGSQKGRGNAFAHNGNKWCGSVANKMKSSDCSIVVNSRKVRVTLEVVKSGINL